MSYFTTGGPLKWQNKRKGTGTKVLEKHEYSTQYLTLTHIKNKETSTAQRNT